MADPSPRRVAIDAVVARAMKLDTGYELHQLDPVNDGEWHTIVALHPDTGKQLKDDQGPIYERFRPIIGEN